MNTTTRTEIYLGKTALKNPKALEHLQELPIEKAQLDSKTGLVRITPMEASEDETAFVADLPGSMGFEHGRDSDGMSVARICFGDDTFEYYEFEAGDLPRLGASVARFIEEEQPTIEEAEAFLARLNEWEEAA